MNANTMGTTAASRPLEAARRADTEPRADQQAELKAPAWINSR
jgi:hypothetical protein